MESSRWGRFLGGLAAPEIDEEGFQRVQNRKRCNLWSSNTDVLPIESKPFQIVETNSLRGTLFHIIERRPHLSRSIIVPLAASHSQNFSGSSSTSMFESTVLENEGRSD